MTLAPTNIAMDQTSWLDLSLSPDGEVIPIPPSPPKSPRKSPLSLSACTSPTHLKPPSSKLPHHSPLIEGIGLTNFSPAASSPPKLTRSRSLLERATSRASQHSASPNTSRTDVQHHQQQQQKLSGRPSLPPWDRTVDVVYHKYRHGDPKPDKSTAINALTNKFFALHKRNKPNQVSSADVKPLERT